MVAVYRQFKRSCLIRNAFCAPVILKHLKMYCDWPQLGKCCFCLPLRKGVIIFAYINIIFCAFMTGIASYTIHNNSVPPFLAYSRILNFPAEVCITMYCAEVPFNIALIYGAHKKLVFYIKAYYYFALVTTFAIPVLQILDLLTERFHYYLFLETFISMFAGLCMQLYLITAVRSLLMKMKTDGPHVYDNQLHQIVTGEVIVETNGVYNNLTTPTEVKNLNMPARLH